MKIIASGDPLKGQYGVISEGFTAAPGLDVWVEVMENGCKVVGHWTLDELELVPSKPIALRARYANAAVSNSQTCAKLTPGQRIYVEGWIPCLLKGQTNNGNILVELDRHIPAVTKDKVISWGAKHGAHNVEETRQLLASKSWTQNEFSLRDKRW